MFDISAAGNVTVIITPRDGSDVTFQPSDFSADGSPVRYGREEVASGRIDMNGKMFSETLRRPLTVELYPIPNSDGDRDFMRKLMERWTGEAEIEKLTVTWTLYLGEQTTKSFLTFSDGIVSAGSFGTDVTQEGRFTSNPYVFKFANVEGTVNAMSQYSSSKKNNGGTGKTSGNQAKPKMKPGAIFYMGSNSPNNIYQMARW